MRTQFGKRALATLAITGLVTMSRPAHAAGETDARRLIGEAEHACLTGDYQRGVDILVKLYISSRHPTYLYNQARCFEQNGQYKLAAGRYREFLLKLNALAPEAPERADLASKNLERLNDHIASLDRQADAVARPAADSERAKRSGGPGTAEKSSSGSAPLSPAQTLTAAAPEQDTGAGLRRMGVTAMVLGGLSLATGVTFGLLTNETTKKAEAAAVYDPDQIRFGERSAKIATVGFIAAPILVGLGTLLYWQGSPPKQSREGAKVSATPFWLANGMGALLAVQY